MDASDIINYVQFTKEIATSGQPEAHRFSQIAKADYQAVLNLAMADSDLALANEGSVVSGCGMVYIHIPVHFAAPDIAQFHLFRDIMQHFWGRKLWVHCVMNFRVSAFMYLYMLHVRGWTEADASSPVFECWQPDAIWRRFLDTPAEQVLANQGDALVVSPRQ